MNAFLEVAALGRVGRFAVVRGTVEARRLQFNAHESH
jgi:hypothetical protein